GTVDVSNSSTLSVVIGGIPFGTGYQISLHGTTTDGQAVCAGSATFDVSSAGTTTVPVHLTCDVRPVNGSILVNGTLNTCPRIDSLGASPAEVAVGGTIALSASAFDADNGPSPLVYSWTATSGSLIGASTATPTLTCAKVG